MITYLFYKERCIYSYKHERTLDIKSVDVISKIANDIISSFNDDDWTSEAITFDIEKCIVMFNDVANNGYEALSNQDIICIYSDFEDFDSISIEN